MATETWPSLSFFVIRYKQGEEHEIARDRETEGNQYSNSQITQKKIMVEFSAINP